MQMLRTPGLGSLLLLSQLSLHLGEGLSPGFRLSLTEYPLHVRHCPRPTGQNNDIKPLYSEVGRIHVCFSCFHVEGPAVEELSRPFPGVAGLPELRGIATGSYLETGENEPVERL